MVKREMVSQCANPACSAPLRRFREGRLFQIEIRMSQVQSPGTETSKCACSRQTHHFWLCGSCSRSNPLAFRIHSRLSASIVRPLMNQLPSGIPGHAGDRGPQTTQSSAAPEEVGPRLGDYGLIGDCRAAALISINGSIEWLCWPRFDK